MIRSAITKDAKAIATIYNYYVKNSIATFDTTEVSDNQFAIKIKNIVNNYKFLVYEIENEIVGYAYANSWNNRCAYEKTVEVSVYIHPKNIKKGIGSELYKALFEWLTAKKIHAVIGGISLPNEKSVRLHEKFGFKKVAHFKQVGYKFNKWIDVGYWQRIL